ncbi:MAG: acyl-CoA dehydrogenase family protein, partial [Pseudomonadota bacterium]
MYASPTKLIRFLLQHGVSLEACFDGSDVDYDEELVTQVISSADEFARGVFSPLNPVGDRHPPTLVDKAVVTSPGFQEAYAQYVEAGWQSLSVPVHYGGMGLPNTLAAVTCEFFCSANVALNLAPTLTGSAIKTLIAHGSDAQKDTYLPRMVTGAWSGTMDLTEPQSGSDLGGIRTKAVETADGSYELTGQKIYITWG